MIKKSINYQWAVAYLAVAFPLISSPVQGQTPDESRAQGTQELQLTVSSPEPRQYELETEGRTFLLDEAMRASFFMLGELHGENEIPTLIRRVWPEMWAAGYRHIAAEVSPWAANELEFGRRDGSVVGLWRQSEATFVTSLKVESNPVLWGCDIEEAQPQSLIRALATANPGSQAFQQAAETVKNGYQRQMAAALLELVSSASVEHDLSIGSASLRENLTRTLEVETDRFNRASLSASLRRERVMKELFHDHWVRAGRPKVFLRFGRNHLHRGIDRRGVSTLGNFVAELAVTENLQVFNVAAFAGGGKFRMSAGGAATDIDERYDSAFAYLASIARYPETVFDLRPLRDQLHRIPVYERSVTEVGLLYWADSYDAIIFYKEVTPLSSFN